MNCPSCDSTNVHASHSRGALERLVRTVTRTQYFRCHTCGHRARHEVDQPRSARDLIFLFTAIVLVAVAGAALATVAHRWLEEGQQQAEQAPGQRG